MSLERERKHLPILIAVCFIGNFALGGVGQAFPFNSFGQLFAWQWGALLFMAGSSLYAAKLATDKWHISSAGFILLTIGMGILYTMQAGGFGEQTAPLYAVGIMAFIPGMVFICYYSGFPVWLRAFGLIATFPFIILMAKIDMKQYNSSEVSGLDIISWIMVQLPSIFWSYFAFRPYRKTKTQQ